MPRSLCWDGIELLCKRIGPTSAMCVYGHADQVERFTVFNIGGNKYRLIVDIHFNRSIIFIHRVLTHKEYDAGDWKGG